MIIQVIGVTFVKNIRMIRQELPIDGDFNSIDRKGQNVFDNALQISMKVADKIWITDFLYLQKIIS